jgi:hypothetical protein
MWCLPLMYSRQYVDEDSRLWDITTCRLVRRHRRFGRIVVVSSSGPSSPTVVFILRGVCGPAWRSRYSDSLRAGRSGDRISVGVEFFCTCPDRPWGPPILLYNGHRVFPGVKSGRDVTLTPHPLLVPWSRKRSAIPLLTLWAARPVQSLSACTRVHYYYIILVINQLNA